MARRFVPKVHLAHDDHDANSSMSDTPLQLPASARVPSNTSALVTFSQAGSDVRSGCEAKSCECFGKTS